MFLIFDLDGVLVDFKKLHEKAFILSWNKIYPEYQIDVEFHRKYLEALPTKKKTDKCKEILGTEPDENVYVYKQEITQELLLKEPINTHITSVIKQLTKEYTLACCSNSIKQTVLTSLKRLDIHNCFKYILSNEDVSNAKPSPEIYLKVMKEHGVEANECLIFEDSTVGLEAAKKSGAHVIQVVDTLDLTYEFIKNCINTKSRIPIGVNSNNFKINLVIPMAGLGSRFQKEGYTTQKPFLPVFGKKMYSWVIDNLMPTELSLRSKIKIYIIIREDQKNNLSDLDKDTSIHVRTVPSLTEGPACTVLSIKDIINNDNPLIIANSDQYLEWDSDTFYYNTLHPSYDGCISVFDQPNELDIKWSYVKLKDNIVSETAEKKYISSHASTGIYSWKKGSDFVKYTEQMISKNIRVNNEFYVCPVYNEAIQQENLKFRIHNCKKLWGLGIPKDYEHFLSNWSPN